jgi:xanthosine utilization system XapX-like protein
VNTFLLTYFATYNTKRIELSHGSALNYQGTTFKNFLIVLPLMFIPMIIVGIFALFSMANVALTILAVLGVLGLLFQKQLITLCVNQFNRRKYALCEGFRQTE